MGDGQAVEFLILGPLEVRVGDNRRRSPAGVSVRCWPCLLAEREHCRLARVADRPAVRRRSPRKR